MNSSDNVVWPSSFSFCPFSPCFVFPLINNGDCAKKKEIRGKRSDNFLFPLSNPSFLPLLSKHSSLINWSDVALFCELTPPPAHPRKRNRLLRKRKIVKKGNNFQPFPNRDSSSPFYLFCVVRRGGKEGQCDRFPNMFFFFVAAIFGICFFFRPIEINKRRERKRLPLFFSPSPKFEWKNPSVREKKEAWIVHRLWLMVQKKIAVDPKTFRNFFPPKVRPFRIRNFIFKKHSNGQTFLLGKPQYFWQNLFLRGPGFVLAEKENDEIKICQRPQLHRSREQLNENWKRKKDWHENPTRFCMKTDFSMYVREFC